MMSAGALRVVIEQGATWTRTFTYKDTNGALVDLTGYEARMQVRSTYDASSALISLTSDPAAGIVMGGALGTIVCTIADTVTAALTAPNECVWDLELILPASAGIKRLLEGEAFISPEVTK
jgi:hypothetical protein